MTGCLKDSVLEVERKLMKRVPREEWTMTHHRIIFSEGTTVKLKIRNARYVRCWMFAAKERNV